MGFGVRRGYEDEREVKRGWTTKELEGKIAGGKRRSEQYLRTVSTVVGIVGIAKTHPVEHPHFAEGRLQTSHPQAEMDCSESALVQ